MGDVLSPQEKRTIALLTAYHKMQSVVLAVSLSPFEVVANDCIPDFQEIVEQSNIALDAWLNLTAHNRHSRLK